MVNEWTYPMERPVIANPSCPGYRMMVNKTKDGKRRDLLATFCSGVVSQLGRRSEKGRGAKKSSYRRARPTTQIIDELMPCRKRATAMTA